MASSGRRCCYSKVTGSSSLDRTKASLASPVSMCAVIPSVLCGSILIPSGERHDGSAVPRCIVLTPQDSVIQRETTTAEVLTIDSDPNSAGAVASVSLQMQSLNRPTATCIDGVVAAWAMQRRVSRIIARYNHKLNSLQRAIRPTRARSCAPATASRSRLLPTAELPSVETDAFLGTARPGRGRGFRSFHRPSGRDGSRGRGRSSRASRGGRPPRGHHHRQAHHSYGPTGSDSVRSKSAPPKIAAWTPLNTAAVQAIQAEALLIVRNAVRLVVSRQAAADKGPGSARTTGSLSARTTGSARTTQSGDTGAGSQPEGPMTEEAAAVFSTEASEVIHTYLAEFVPAITRMELLVTSMQEGWHVDAPKAGLISHARARSRELVQIVAFLAEAASCTVSGRHGLSRRQYKALIHSMHALEEEEEEAKGEVQDGGAQLSAAPAPPMSAAAPPPPLALSARLPSIGECSRLSVPKLPMDRLMSRLQLGEKGGETDGLGSLPGKPKLLTHKPSNYSITAGLDTDRFRTPLAHPQKRSMLSPGNPLDSAGNRSLPSTVTARSTARSMLTTGTASSSGRLARHPWASFTMVDTGTARSEEGSGAGAGRERDKDSSLSSTPVPDVSPVLEGAAGGKGSALMPPMSLETENKESASQQALQKLVPPPLNTAPPPPPPPVHVPTAQYDASMSTPMAMGMGMGMYAPQALSVQAAQAAQAAAWMAQQQQQQMALLAMQAQGMHGMPPQGMAHAMGGMYAGASPGAQTYATVQGPHGPMLVPVTYMRMSVPVYTPQQQQQAWDSGMPTQPDPNVYHSGAYWGAQGM